MKELLISFGLDPVLANFLVMVIVGSLLVTFFAVFAGFATYLERRLSAKFQSRVGPNRVGPFGLLQWLADAVKLILKEDILPTGADKLLFRLAPFIIVAGLFPTFVVLPWGKDLIPADLNVGILYFVAITALVVVAILMAGWGSNSKWALLGGMRAAAQIVTYEIPVAMGLLPVIMVAGSLSVGDLMAAQGAMPWEWFAFQTPFTALAFFIFFVGSIAEANRVPFDLPEAESELVAGFFTEYTGFRFAVFGMAEFGGMWVISAMTAAVFLGGGNIPMFLTGHVTGIAFTALTVLVYLSKVAFVLFLIIWLRWTLPRFRIDQMMEFSWKYLLPMSFIAFFGQSILMLFTHDMPLVGAVMGKVIFMIFAFVLMKFILRVIQNHKEQATPVNSKATDKFLTPEPKEEPQAEAAGNTQPQAE